MTSATAIINFFFLYLSLFIKLCGVFLFPSFSRTKSRCGDIDQSTGVTSNFIMSIDLPSDKPSSHWIERGVAAIAQQQM